MTRLERQLPKNPSLLSIKQQKDIAQDIDLSYPSAGLPDLQAINRVFGLTPNMLYDEPSRQYQGKPRPPKHSQGSKVDFHGNHEDFTPTSD